ncbi:tail fiber assembly protein [Serratia proteamaculans]|uniref:tail fiber assembly protein n=1 Tax=Serratia proteamaculans TaxID=28151 RepID=UPI002179FEAE|nr:tail fiber assembly protein [Serratia proteamaculans]CAI1755559.1 Caudovirales tail fibre assembly protein [Serratia proteamaculans]
MKIAKESETLKNSVELYTIRYFITIDEDSYVNGMMIAFNQDEAEIYVNQGLIELPKEVFEEIGQDAQYIDSKVVQGAPRVIKLSQDMMKTILSSMMLDVSNRINILKDAIELDIATESEKNSIDSLREYRVLLSRVDPGNDDISTWPIYP